MFIMITVILSLTDSIEYGQEDWQVRGAGTGGVSTIGQECLSASISWYPIWAVALCHLPKEVTVRARRDFAWPKLLTADGRGIAFGGDYNPDQWPEEIWDDDIRLMGQAGVNTVALAIFSWDRLQPTEDHWDFD